VHYGPVGSVSNYYEFIGVELDHIPKRKGVLHNLIYMCANLKKKIELRKYLFQVSKQS
jgi:hypothetical protein